jgi:FtsZ-binding cell division protein ZapB
MQTQYFVSNCPITDIDGDYTFNDHEGVYYIVTTRKYRIHKVGAQWAISTENSKFCQNFTNSSTPPSSGWEFWKKSLGKYVACKYMEVKPNNSNSSLTRPVTATKTSTPLEQPNVIPSSAASAMSPIIDVNSPPQKLTLNNDSDYYGGWAEKVVRGMVGSSKIYEHSNGQHSATPPPEYLAGQMGEGQVVSYTLASVNEEGRIEVFSPASYAKSTNREIIQRGFYKEFNGYAPFWAHSVRVLEKEIRDVNAKIVELKEKEAAFPAERQRIQAEITRLDKSLQEVKARERTTQQKSDSMLSRVGKSHIKRDWQQTRVGSGFPAGEDYRTMFMEKFLDFESFACDAVNCLEDLQHPDPAGVLVREVMLPVYNRAVREIKQRTDAAQALLKEEYGSVLPANGEDTIVKLFWYSTMQNKLFHDVMKMEVTRSTQMTMELGGTVVQLYHEMVRQGNENLIANDENCIRIDKLLRNLLELQTVAVLSDPTCFLQPSPGEFVAYKENFCLEIMSPGTKMHGRIKEGDKVEVVMCGLYFEDATNKFDSVKPVVPCLVRRLVAAKK